MSELSYLEKLLDGVEVEWLPLSGLARIRNGKDHKSLSEGEFPVYGSGGIMRYVDTYAYNKPSVLIPRKGSLGNLFFVNVPFWTVDTIFYTEIDEAQIRPKYLYYFLTTVGLGEMNQAGGVPSQTQSVLNKLKIPIPCPDNPEKSLAIQSEIVRILDKFTALTAELTAELNMRKKQYNYYRDQLLSFKDGEVEWKTLGEVAQYSKTRISFELLDERNYVGVDNLLQNRAGKSLSNHVPTSGKLTEFIPNDILIGNIRPYLKKIWQADCIGGTNGDVLVIRCIDSSINTRYLYQILADDKFFEYNMQHAKGAKMPRGSKEDIMKYPIPVPPLTLQARIVEILNKFDTLTNSITEGLPREIELRQKQYEYYRDLLFSFPKPETASN
ncbi:restriction endonuclease subunit S (plasmid) [Escherichia coli]|uniref:restriction endonuclease subunit S n=1 Tax=Escherichia coli TaxID=562 RepID=UPI00287057DD|nr:restriction endonuclease subunit S [Escherichia coli]WNB72672.1 restriction endonuclease subunit S [Escherichia coli]